MVEVTVRGLVAAEEDRRRSGGERPLTASERSRMLEADDPWEADRVRRAIAGLPPRDEEDDEDLAEDEDEDDDVAMILVGEDDEGGEEDEYENHWPSDLEEDIAARRAERDAPFGSWERYVLEHGRPPPEGRFATPPKRPPPPPEPEPEPEPEIDPREERARKRFERRATKWAIGGAALLGFLAWVRSSEKGPKAPAGSGEPSGSAPPSVRSRIVREGETLESVALGLHVAPEELAAMNPTARSLWAPGLVLVVPSR